MMYLTAKIAVRCFKLAIDVIFLPVIIHRMLKKSRRCPPITNDILLYTATQLSEKIRKKQITSTAAVQAYIDRIKEVNPIINAIIEDRFVEALKEAQAADDIVKETSEAVLNLKYPLLGVPITIKGSVAVKGMIHTSGRVDHQETAEKDADAVKKVKDAGAIVLLISNVPELCLNWESANKLVGSTVNPYDSRRTSAGSSGGEASLLGAGASLIGIGSDIAGSLRLPAHCCGVWGHKPTPHVVSSVGHYPDCKNKEEWNRVFTLGPMARYASDLKPLLQIMTETEMKKLLKLEEPVDVRKIKVYYMMDPDSPFTSRTDDVTRKVVDEVISHFSEICEVKDIEIPLMKHCVELSFLPLLKIDGVENIFDNKKNGACTELLKYYLGRSNHQFTSILYVILNNKVKSLGARLGKIEEKLRILTKQFQEMLQEGSVFIMPTSPSEAFFQGESIRSIMNASYLSIFNSLGLPVTNCPVTFSPNGLPIGVQVVCAPFMDRIGLAVAEEIERSFGGWKFT